MVRVFVVILVLILEVCAFAYHQEAVFHLIKQRHELCRLPAKTGKCRYNIHAWYYNHVTKKCERFYYSGCGGNMNRFYNSFRCEDFCIEYRNLIPYEMK